MTQFAKGTRKVGKVKSEYVRSIIAINNQLNQKSLKKTAAEDATQLGEPFDDSHSIVLP